MFVGIRPVEYLFLDKLAAGYGTEGCAGEIQIMLCLQRHQSLIKSLTHLHLFLRFRILGIYALRFLGYACSKVLLVVVFPGILPPCTKVVFIKNDTIPMHLLNPLVGSFDTTHTVCSEHILE